MIQIKPQWFAGMDGGEALLTTLMAKAIVNVNDMSGVITQGEAVDLAAAVCAINADDQGEFCQNLDFAIAQLTLLRGNAEVETPGG